MTRIDAARSPSLAAWAWALFAMAVGTALARLEPNLLEEGAHLHIAERLADGERLYRDVVFFTGPLPFELLALLFRVFGDELFVARGAIVLLQGLATAATFAIARRAGAGPLAHGAAATFAVSPALGFPMLSLYFYTTLAFYLVPLAVYAAIRAPGAPRWAVGTGLLVGCVALCKQTLGLALAASLAAALVASCARGARLATLGSFALGGSALAALTLGYYTAVGGLWDFVDATVLMPLSLSETFELPFPNLWPIGAFEDAVFRSLYLYVPNLYYTLTGKVHFWVPRWLIASTQLGFAMPYAMLLATALLRLRGPLPRAVWLHAAGLLALTSNLYPRTDWGHLIIVLPAALVHLQLLWPLADAARLAGRTGRRRRLAALGAGLIGLAGVLVCVQLERLSEPPSYGPRVPLRPVSATAKDPVVPRIIAYLREHAEENEVIFVARAEPLIYFATATRNATPFIGAISGHRDLQERAILPALEQARYVVMSEIDQPGFHFYSKALPSVYAYLERHFRLAPDLRSAAAQVTRLFERGPDRGATLADLERAYFGQEPWARPWIRDADRLERPHPPHAIRIGSHQLRRPVPVTLGARGGGIDFAFAPLPANAVFQADIGLRTLDTSAGTLLHPPGVWMQVSVAAGGEFEVLRRERIATSAAAGQHWRPFEVDLSAYAGRNATLRLEVLPYRREHVGLLAWWGSPRLAQRAAAAP